MVKSRQYRRLLALRVSRLSRLAQLVILIIATGYWFAQGVNGDYYRELAENNRLREHAIVAPRGLIFDRKGLPLVENVPSYNLFLDRSLSASPPASLQFAAPILEQQSELLAKVLDRYRSVPTFQPVRLAEGLSLAQVSRFGVEHLEHPEFEMEVEHLRLYRHAHQTAHVLGYLGEVTSDELRRLGEPYRGGDLLGKQGLEGVYENLLRGAAGHRVVVVDSRGRQVEEHQRSFGRAGGDLRLTLDLALQQEAARLLEDHVGAIVAMDPRDGNVLAMVSSPSFNPNHFARRLGREEWLALIDNPHHPLQNRAIQNTYPPGSLFKLVMAVAGLKEGVVRPQDTVVCRGAAKFYGQRRRCWWRSGHGTVNLHDALERSCDIYFYQLGQKLEIDAIARYARLFGLGSSTGIDLRGEKKGLVPDTQWSLNFRRERWYPGETLSVAIGQGPILTTPLQIAVMTAAVANGGRRLQPRLVESDQPQIEEDLKIEPRHMELVRRSMYSVVHGKKGTAKVAHVAGFEISGKTGTVQVVHQESWTRSESLPPELRDHAWFTSFAPFDEPRLVVVVFVEHGGTGSRAAAPLARAMYEKFFAADLARRSDS